MLLWIVSEYRLRTYLHPPLYRSIDVWRSATRVPGGSFVQFEGGLIGVKRRQYRCLSGNIYIYCICQPTRNRVVRGTFLLSVRCLLWYGHCMQIAQCLKYWIGILWINIVINCETDIIRKHCTSPVWYGLVNVCNMFTSIIMWKMHDSDLLNPIM